MKRKAFFTCVISLRLISAPALGDEIAVWQSAVNSGSKKLAYYSLMKTRPEGAERYLVSFMNQDGLAHRKGEPPRKLAAEFTIRPLLGYDSNLNNGVPGSGFAIGDLNFVVDEENVAKKGITLGISASGYSAYSVAPKQVVTFKIAASYEYAPEHDLYKTGINASACLQSHIAKWTWLNSCGGYRHFKKATVTEEKYALFTGTQMFSTSLGDHEASMTFERGFREDYAKSRASLSLLSAVQGLGAVYTGIRWGEPIKHQHTTLKGATIALTRPMFGKTTSVSFDYYEAGGGTHFGLPRADKTYTVMVKRPVNKHFVASIGYQVNHSNVDLYKENQVLFGLDLKAWRF